MRWKSHVRFGGRAGETHAVKATQGAPVRPLLDAVTRYRCVDARKAEGFPVAAACDAAEVSTSAYYAWAAKAARGPCQRALDDATLLADIRRIHRGSGGTYGAPRVTRQLRREGRVVNRKKVEKMMADNGIVGHRPKRRGGLTRPDKAAPPAPDLVGRLFDPDEMDHTWVSDVTYVPTDEGWLYLPACWTWAPGGCWATA